MNIISFLWIEALNRTPDPPSQNVIIVHTVFVLNLIHKHQHEVCTKKMVAPSNPSITFTILELEGTQIHTSLYKVPIFATKYVQIIWSLTSLTLVSIFTILNCTSIYETVA